MLPVPWTQVCRAAVSFTLYFTGWGFNVWFTREPLIGKDSEWLHSFCISPEERAQAPSFSSHPLLFIVSAALDTTVHKTDLKTPCPCGVCMLSVGEWQQAKLIHKVHKRIMGEKSGLDEDVCTCVCMCVYTYRTKNIWGKSIPSTGNYKCKGVKVGMYLAVWDTME